MKHLAILFTVLVMVIIGVAAADAAMILGATLNGNDLFDFSGPGILAADLRFRNDLPIMLTVLADAEPLPFNSLVDIFPPLTEGIASLSLALGGGGAVAAGRECGSHHHRRSVGHRDPGTGPDQLRRC